VKTDLVVTKNFNTEGAHKLATYEDNGGYRALKKVCSGKVSREKIIEEVKGSGLRGRGGAGFPTGLKWTFLPPKTDKPRYLCCNADEGEPGTFKDRDIMRYDPHLLIEGIAISCFALKIEKAFIYIRGEFFEIAEILNKAIKESAKAGYLGKNIINSGFDLEITVHLGAGAYICGEETSLIESLEGKRGNPRLRPPYPAVFGLYGCPTIVNNVETLANVPLIIEHGASWYRKFGTEKSPGTKIFCLSGHINKPGNYELPLGVNLLELIEKHGGGVLGGRKLKAVIPGGVSSQILKADECDIPMDFESLAKAGSMLGSASVIVMDERTSMPHALEVICSFFAHESCGQCSQCREGTKWMADIVKRIINGSGKTKDLDLLLDIAGGMKAKTICVFSDAAAAPVESFITKFRDEFEGYIKEPRIKEGLLRV
jgi:NADH-quinone oxidoreductase subunit F